MWDEISEEWGLEAPEAPEADDAEAWGARRERQVEMLEELSEIFLDLTRDIAVCAKSQIAEQVQGHIFHFRINAVVEIQRLGQSLRRTLALETHLADAADKRAARRERQLQMLAELSEIFLELTRDMAACAKDQIREQAEGFVQRYQINAVVETQRLGQSLRRTLALETRLHEGELAGGLFAKPGPMVNLHADQQAPRVPAADRPAGAALSAERAGDRDRGETIAADLGPFTEPREILLEVPNAPAQALIGDLCRDMGLDPTRLAWHETTGLMVGPDPSDPEPQAAIPLRDWRPTHLAGAPFPPSAGPPPPEGPEPAEPDSPPPPTLSSA